MIITEPPVRRMAALATSFVETLTPGQRSRVVLPLEGDNRLDWHYFPRQRAGLHLMNMTEPQAVAAQGLLRFALSEVGWRKVEQIRQLEAVLNELFHQSHRDPGDYAMTVFGDPRRDRWGWRFEGHHLSLNFTVIQGAVAVTPAFTGAHPAHVHCGPLKGLRVLGAEQDLAFGVLGGLSDRQRERAVIAADSPGDIVTGPQRNETLGQPRGVPLGELAGKVRDRAVQLIGTYAGNLREEFARQQLQTLEAAGWESIHFAWAGSQQPGRPHYYRLHGPRLLIEYDNTRNDANHIHAVWRDPLNDFGLDWLAEHYRGHSHP
ncbi:MAG: DUF3500 domain-containing protein [Candidatus Competibacteraceae bacterium]|nr:DUF3500 domain-containing protein [Candidatus Competibacteraceae bacterium]